MKTYIGWLGLAAATLLAGCGDTLNADFTKPEMRDKGMVYILPGIQGVDYHYLNIRKGLIGAGVPYAVKIHPWGCQIPGINLAINQTDTKDDRQWGATIAQEIADYQGQYPGRPVFIIGQSGGAGVAVFAAEAMANIEGASRLAGLVLLDGSISADYDLNLALSRCSEGIVNFYNLSDVALLEYGTGLMGNVDGGHGASAGLKGFTGSFAGLYQVQVTQDMVDDFESPHFADCSQAFTAQYIAPWVIDRGWPPSHIRLGGE